MFDTPLLTGNMYRETSLYVLASSVTHGNETMNLESVVALVLALWVLCGCSSRWVDPLSADTLISG